jgi:hypothetical protein
VNIAPTEKISELANIAGVYSVTKEEDKIRILMSMVPFLGIIISSKFDHPLIERGRIIGSTLAFLYIISLLFSGSEGFFPFIILALGVLLFVVEGVYLMLYGRFISWGVLEKLPSYREIEAIIVASFGQTKEFVAVSMGKEKTLSFRENYTSLLEPETQNTPTEKYFMPASLLAIPFWNLFGIPSLFIEKYRAYRGLVIE